ncbi:helix-turn-helix transcriptional regulator [Acetobacterium wieringae]|uniref:Helix-turn-helix transcriptional regulator n=1 Tax=Acetobacterium wieringae TaxID=52694 RepID=A0ABY6HHF4_9FIRM|nr:helix-turn-helix transcriptional regulator [Acetobacterium wieringae]UYO62966.1 helix-turn-helix transcriptional regulator [Acetobacterium wieringae]VUZ26888.1 Uncharacterised protein [Acetobacterium wieringae]
MRLNTKSFDVAMANACIDIKTLSTLSGVSKQTLFAIRNEKRNPKPATIGKIAKALNVSVVDIIEKEA